MILSLIVAVARNGVIGCAGKLPWHLSDDLKRFKRLTTGHTVIMGRKTFESIGKPLPNRRNVVLTRQPGFAAPGVEVCRTLPEALALLPGEDEVFVIGGAEVYRQTWPLAQRLHLTRVEAEVPGDACLPEFDLCGWELLEEESHPVDARHAYPFRYQLYRRRE